MSDIPSSTPTVTAGVDDMAETHSADETQPHGARRASPATRTRGDTVGRYVILEPVGRGGMGIVYSAYDPQLDRKVAVKVVRSLSPHSSARGRARLLREAQALARLAHPNVVTVHDVGEVGEEVFVAMEFLAGQTLTAWMGGQRTWREAVAVFVAAGRGLAAAHAAGLIHRDFKPDNVILTEDGRVVVLDFGLAREDLASSRSASDGTPMAASLEQSAVGSIVGTPAYMSPEQLLGAEVDARSDQFSLCVALWEALYGERPFPATSLAELRASVLTGQPQRPERPAPVPAWLHQALLVGLARAPDQRHPSMDALLEHLQRDGGRWRWWAAGAAAVVLVAASRLTDPRAALMDACVTRSGRISASWSDEDRAALAAAFEGGGGETSELPTELVADLDDYARALAVEDQRACVAERDPATDAIQASAWRGCVERHRQRLDTLVDVLIAPTTDLDAAGPATMTTLGTPSTCAEGGDALQNHPMPAEPELRERVEQLRLELVALDGFKLAGNFAAAIEPLDGWIARARDIGYDPLVAFVLLERAQVAVQLADWPTAKERATEALLLAETGGFDRVVVDSLMVLARERHTAGDVEEAGLRFELALATARRIGSKTMQATVLVDLARNIARADDADRPRAERMILEAIGLLPPGHHTQLLVARDVLGVLQHQMGKLDAGYATLTAAIDDARDHVGKSHPVVGNAYIHRGNILTARGDFDAAIEDYERASRMFARSFDGYHPSIGAAKYQLAFAYLYSDRVEESIVVLDELGRLMQTVSAPANGARGQVAIVLAEGLLAAGRPAEALERLGPWLDEVSPTVGRGARWQVEYLRVRAQLQLGRTSEALSRAVDLLAAVEAVEDPSSRWLIDPLLVLGAARLHSSDAPGAISSIERALAIFATLEESQRDTFADEVRRGELDLATALDRAGIRAEDAEALREGALAVMRTRPKFFAPQLENLK
jgi:tetratricopeptide (TPR) repeat protein/predicted Ser/Thr protein kinase